MFPRFSPNFRNEMELGLGSRKELHEILEGKSVTNGNETWENTENAPRQLLA